MDLFQRFSSRENLKKAYKYVKDEVAHSSLSVTPINYASITAIDNLGEQFFIALEKYIRDGKYAPEKGYFVYIPKDNLGLRPVCIPAMVDRIVYQAILNQKILGFKIDSQLSEKFCFANRVNEKESGDSFLAFWLNGYDSFLRKQKKAFEKGYRWKLELDIQQFYENIPIKKLINKLKEEFGIKDERILSILESQLNAWAEYDELPKGLPQGPNASAVLSNAYLNALDKFTAENLIGKELVYFRYADDMVLMGKSKQAVLRATEKLVYFLREHHLALNEKTRITELQDSSPIEEMRIMSDYDEYTPEIPKDEFEAIQANVPYVVEKMAAGEKVEKNEIRELRYYLSVGREYDLDFLINLISIIPISPSFVIAIIKYISEARQALEILGNKNSVEAIDMTLWQTYKNAEISDWSKFWILKLLVSNKSALEAEITKEIKNILTSKSPTIFKIVGFYFQAIRGQKINIALVKRAIADATMDVEKSWYSFFLLNAFEGIRMPVVQNCIEQTLNSPSQELSLVGCYLYQSKPQVKIEDFDGLFASYILQKRIKLIKAKSEPVKVTEDDYFLVRRESLIPVSSPNSILGVTRKRRVRHTVDLVIPEKTNFEKVLLKLKEGRQEVEIWYKEKHIITTDYAKLGFYVGVKQQKPDRSWGFIHALAVLSATDITQATPENMKPMVAANAGIALTTQNIHQIKKTLTRKMRDVFKTDDNPFHDNKHYYQPKFTILPPPTLRQEEVWQQGGELNENLPYEDN